MHQTTAFFRQPENIILVQLKSTPSSMKFPSLLLVWENWGLYGMIF